MESHNALQSTQLVCSDTGYHLKGHSHIKFFTLNIDDHENLDFVQLKNHLCEWLVQQLGGDVVHSVITEVNGRQEMKIETTDMILYIPLAIDDTKHVSLFSSNDLKKHNKPLYKGYQNDPIAFTAHLERLAHPLILKVNDIVLKQRSSLN